MNTRKPTILLIDDAADDLLLLKRCLLKVASHANILTLNDGLEAISYFMGEGKYADRTVFPYPTFIITDLKMPGADGFAVLNHLKANPTWAVIPTVVMTGSADPDDVRTAYLLGASSYQQKPDSYEMLGERMKTLYEYWMNCVVPEVDVSGRQVHTNSKGKLGERFVQPNAGGQHRAPDESGAAPCKKSGR